MQGILLKKKNGGGIILTRDGGFCQGKIGEDTSLGEEAAVDPPRQKRPPWFMAAAAVIAVAALSFGVYRTLLPSTWAYVALDMEPSIEISLDRGLVITGQKGFNTTGRKLAALEDLRGKTLEAGVDCILERALAAGYLKEGKDNVVMVTAAAGTGDERLNAGALSHLVAKCFPVLRGRTEIVAVCTDKGTRNKAAKDGLSAGRYLLLQEVHRRGLNIAGTVVQEGSLDTLEREGNHTVAALVGDKGFVLVRSGGDPMQVPGQKQGPPSFFAAPVPEREK